VESRVPLPPGAVVSCVACEANAWDEPQSPRRTLPSRLLRPVDAGVRRAAGPGPVLPPADRVARLNGRDGG
jgi:hypothetical protein